MRDDVKPKPRRLEFRYWLRELNFWREQHAEFFFGLFMVALVVLGLVGIWSIVQHGNREEQKFMTECLQDHKHYECEALWRGKN